MISAFVSTASTFALLLGSAAPDERASPLLKVQSNAAAPAGKDGGPCQGGQGGQGGAGGAGGAGGTGGTKAKN